jgi:hypothetical protein
MVGERASLHDLHRLELLQTCLLCDLVLSLVSVVLKVSDVCDVAYITDLVAEVLEKFYEYVICHARTCVTEVCVAINSRTADVKSYVSLVDRLEDLFLSRKGIGYI